MNVQIDLHDFTSALADLHAGLRNGAHQALKASIQAAYESAKNTALFKDKSGALRASVVAGMPEPMRGFLRAGGSGAKYAAFVEDGTAPHDITGKNGGALRFVIDGRVVFRRRVHHPGTKPRPFMDVAAALGEQTLDYGLELFTERPIARFNGG